MKVKRIVSFALTLAICVALIGAAPSAEAAGVARVYRVNGTGVRMRSEPYGYNDANIMGTLKKGATCILLQTKGNWCKITTDSCQIGWVYNRYLSYYGAVDKDTVGICTTNRVPVYANYSTRSRKIGTLNEGNVVVVKRFNATWAEVTTLLGGKSGYMHVGFLKKAYK